MHHADGAAVAAGGPHSRLERQLHFLNVRQRVEFSAQRNCWTWLPTAKHPYNARLGDLRSHLDAELAKPRGDVFRGLKLTVRQLRMLMNVPTIGDYARVDLARKVVNPTM
jgi:hypothetical protein